VVIFFVGVILQFFWLKKRTLNTGAQSTNA
jgi:hypothetical protein